MPATKHNLPDPQTITDFYLLAVLEELKRLNTLMEQALKPRTSASTVNSETKSKK